MPEGETRAQRRRHRLRERREEEHQRQQRGDARREWLTVSAAVIIVTLVATGFALASAGIWARSDCESVCVLSCGDCAWAMYYSFALLPLLLLAVPFVFFALRSNPSIRGLIWSGAAILVVTVINTVSPLPVSLNLIDAGYEVVDESAQWVGIEQLLWMTPVITIFAGYGAFTLGYIRARSVT